VTDYGSQYPDEYLVMNMDSDMWLQMESLPLACRVDLGH